MAEFPFNQKRWRLFLECLPEAVVVADQYGRIIFANAQTANLTGYSQQGLVGEPVEKLLPGHLRDKHIAYREAFAKDPCIRPMGTDLDLYLLKGDGTEVPVEIALCPLQTETETLVLATIRDITRRRRLEKETAALAEQMRRILRFTGEGVYGVDSEGRCTFINRAGLEILGYANSTELVDREMHDVIKPRRRDGTPYPHEECPIGRALRQGRRAKVDDDVLWRADGTSFQATHSVFPIIEDNTIRGAVITFQDISEQKRSEEALRESEERYRSLFERLPVGLYRVTAGGQILDANPALAEMLGYPDVEALSATAAKDLYLNHQDRSQWQALIESKDIIRGYEAALRRSNGTMIWARDSARVVRDTDGKVLYYDGVLEDVTDRKQAKDSLVAKTEQLETIAAAMSTFLTTRKWPETGSVILRGALRQTGSEYGFIGNVVEGPVLRIVAHHGLIWDPVTNREFYEKALETYRNVGYLEFTNFNNLFGQVITTRKPVIANEPAADPRSGGLPDGHPPLHCFLGVPILLKADVVGMVGVANRPGGYTATEQQTLETLAQMASVLYDTELQRAREILLESQLRQAQKMEAVGQLGAGMAHDFNNLLTGIHGYLELLSMEIEPSSRLALDVAEARKLVDRGAALIRQLLAFGRQQTLKPRVIDLNQLVEGTLKMLSQLIREDIELKFFPSSESLNMEVDPVQLEQVLVNLAVNARDAMPNGGKLIIETARTEVVEKDAKLWTEGFPGSYVMLVVSDTGSGMDKETAQRIFEPFFTTKADSGTGLGLATVYGIVKQHGGYISVDSELGKGTTFRICLPPAKAQPEVDSSVKQGKASLAAPETILVVEDEKAIVETVKRYLERRGYHVLAASNPSDAEVLFSQHYGKIALLLSDVVLPSIRGPELYERLLARQPTLKVLFMSGHTEKAATEMIAKSGFPFIQKPFTSSALLEQIRKLAGGNAVSIGARPKVLVADDEPTVRETLRRYLAAKEYFVIEAANGFDALAKVRQENPDLVLLDIHIPGKDGMQVLKEIREYSKKNDKEIGVIMVTGVKDKEICRSARSMGAFEYIIKPFDLEYVEKVLSRKLTLMNEGPAG